MYAIIKTGGKQVKATVGDIIRIEKLKKTDKKKVEFKLPMWVNPY